MIQTYFGNGKGKTTAAVGAAIRFAGSGGRVLFVQFLKNNDSAEFKVLENIDGIDVLFSKENYQLFDNLKKERTPVLAKAYRDFLFENVKSKSDSYQMIILDEVLDSVEFGYVNEDELLETLDELKDNLEIVLTGHNLMEKIKDVSDYISEIKEISHPYKKGVMPRKGIEF